MVFVFPDNMEDKHDEMVHFSESKLLYPEVLEESALLLMLKERHVPINTKELVDRVSLLNLCYKNTVPRPQRNYRSNRRGQMMTQQQIKLYGESSSKPAMLNRNNSIESAGDRLKPPPNGDKLKLSADSDKTQLPQSGDRLKQSPSGDRLKPPPRSERLKLSPTGDRIKPPLLVTSAGQTENKVIKLVNHCTSPSSTTAPCNSFKNDSSKKRIAADEDDKSPPLKRFHLGSSTASQNQGVDGTNKSCEQPKNLLENSEKSKDGSTKKFTKISWP